MSIVLIILGLIQELKINNMTNKDYPKEKDEAIQSLESIAHWMKTSVFDYDEDSLKILLNDVFMDYKRYLTKKNKRYDNDKSRNK